MLLGIKDPWVSLAYILTILSSLLCVVYGLINWNKGEEPAKQEDIDWAKEEKEEVEDSV
ncbi:MAG: symporter small accessory protein [Verrucomicrobiota bacterium]